MTLKRCPLCSRLDAKAGAIWGCRSCKARVDAGYRWWDTASCELCIDPIDKPYIDEDGSRRWRVCHNPATRQVLQSDGRTLNVCEEHFQREKPA
jgi:hypothetical protein